MTKIAIVNDKDEIIGSARKSDARRQGHIHRLVRILMYDEKGNVLLQKRHPKAQDSPNRWDFSAAGHVDEGEDYETAARRELQEELGIRDISLTPLFKFYAEKAVGTERIRRFNMVFLAQASSKTIHPNLNELGGIEWFAKSRIAAMIHDAPDDFSDGLTDTYTQIMDYLDSACLACNELCHGG